GITHRYPPSTSFVLRIRSLMLVIAMLLDKGCRHPVHRRTFFATPVAFGARLNWLRVRWNSERQTACYPQDWRGDAGARWGAGDTNARKSGLFCANPREQDFRLGSSASISADHGRRQMSALLRKMG